MRNNLPHPSEQIADTGTGLVNETWYKSLADLSSSIESFGAFGISLVQTDTQAEALTLLDIDFGTFGASLAATEVQNDALALLNTSYGITYTYSHAVGDVPGTALDPRVLSIIDGNTGAGAVTGIQEPTVQISRIENIPFTGLSDGSDGAALQVSTTSKGGQQTVAVSGGGTTIGTATCDTVALYGIGTAGGASGTAFGSFLQAIASANACGAVGIQMQVRNEATSKAYPPTGSDWIVGLDIQYESSSAKTGMAFLFCRGVSMDVGLGIEAGAVTEADIYTASSSDKILFADAAGSHVDGIDLSSSAFSSTAFASPGFLVTGTGNVAAASIRLDAVTVASLPSAGANTGRRYTVNDATASTFYSVVAGGGGITIPVFSDGTNWRIG